MISPEKLLQILPYYKIALWQTLDVLLGLTLLRVDIYPRQSSIIAHIYANISDERLEQQTIAACKALAQTYGILELQVEIDRSRVVSAKGIYSHLLRLKESRRVQGRQETVYNLIRYKVLPPSARGMLLQINGKKGQRTYSRSVATGKILRGSKIDDLEKYRGQVKDKRGTTGVTVTLVKALPKNLIPTLVLDKSTRLPPGKSREYYRTYYSLDTR